MLAGCNEKCEVPDTHLSDLTFRAILPPQTKVMLSGTTFLWQKGDAINVYNGEAQGKFVSDISSHGTYTQFSGSLSVRYPEDGFWAVYPYNKENSFSDGVFSLSIPPERAPDTNLNGSFPFVAHAPQGSDILQFKNILGGVEFTLSRSDILKIIVTAPGGEPLAGDIKVRIGEDGNPEIVSVENGVSQIEISGYDIMSAHKRYYIPMIPQKLSKGLLFKVFAGDYAEGAMAIATAKEIKRSTFGILEGIDSKIEFKGGSSNCFIMAPQSERTFEARYGISPDKIQGTLQMLVLWESNGSQTAPSKGSVIHSVSASDGFITVKTGSSEGNAVIAAFSPDGVLQWSWHIWVSGREIEVMPDGIMDCNIGALSVNPGDPASFGLYYQYGRKDPFPGTPATPQLPDPVNPGADNQTISYANANPTTFILASDNGVDLYTPNMEDCWWRDSQRSKMDPCPKGWRFPPYYYSGHLSQGNWDDRNKGFLTDNNIWLPAAGKINQSGALVDTGTAVWLWEGSDGPYSISFSDQGSEGKYGGGMCGIPVRCVKM